jgi:hypothetical protein
LGFEGVLNSRLNNFDCCIAEIRGDRTMKETLMAMLIVLITASTSLIAGEALSQKLSQQNSTTLSQHK